MLSIGLQYSCHLPEIVPSTLSILFSLCYYYTTVTSNTGKNVSISENGKERDKGQSYQMQSNQ